MGSVNLGQQVITFSYGQGARSQGFNRFLLNVIPSGVISGGTLSKLTDTKLSIAPLKALIYDVANGVAARIETQAAVELTPMLPATPYVVMRFDWANTISNFADFLQVAYGDLRSDDLILGKALFSGTDLTGAFDYTRKDLSILGSIGAIQNAFRVRSTEPLSASVSILGGSLVTPSGFVTIADGTLALNNTTDGRVDLIYIDTAGGAFAKTEGVDNATPATPDYSGRLVIAEIHRGAGRTTVTGDEITQIYQYGRLYKFA